MNGRTEIAETTASIRKELERLNAAQETSELLTKDLLDTAFRGIVRNYDPNQRRLWKRSKIPASNGARVSLRTYHRSRNCPGTANC